MIAYVFFYAAGLYCLFWAAWFALTQTERAVYTDRVFSDFSGDVTTWLRCVSE